MTAENNAQRNDLLRDAATQEIADVLQRLQNTYACTSSVLLALAVEVAASSASPSFVAAGTAW